MYFQSPKIETISFAPKGTVSPQIKLQQNIWAEFESQER